MVKLYLDDIRNPHQSGYKDSEWIVCRNATEFVSVIEKHFSDLEVISFDHDIDSYNDDGTEVTGYDCVKLLCDYIQDNDIDVDNLKLLFHTANPVGRLNMMCYWSNFKENYERSIDKWN